MTTIQLNHTENNRPTDLINRILPAGQVGVLTGERVDANMLLIAESVGTGNPFWHQMAEGGHKVCLFAFRFGAAQTGTIMADVMATDVDAMKKSIKITDSREIFDDVMLGKRLFDLVVIHAVKDATSDVLPLVAKSFKTATKTGATVLLVADDDTEHLTELKRQTQFTITVIDDGVHVQGQHLPHGATFG